jgi:myo-inositol-1-phosphate synthase
MKTSYTHKYVNVIDNSTFEIQNQNINIEIKNPSSKNVGVMIVGLCGNNGSTLTSSLIAHNKKIEWETKDEKYNIDFLGSLYEYGNINIGYHNNKPFTKLIKDMVPFIKLEQIVVGGWDICEDNLYESCKNNKVINKCLLDQLKNDLEMIKPMKSIYYRNFIAENQSERAKNIKENSSKWDDLKSIINDINTFKQLNDIDKIIVVWSASTEKFTKEWICPDELIRDIQYSSSEVSPSIIFAVASLLTGSIFINTSPQNTISKAILKLAEKYNTFACGSDLKSGQTKLKSVLVDYLVSSGLKPLSIVSYNHLGNRDGMNLDETPQFESKERTKRNVIDDVIDENPNLFKGSRPDHTVVIKYIPAVGDTKRAIDEYFSELFLGGKNILSIYNLCEDSLLAVPIILDLILFSELFSRVSFTLDNDNVKSFNSDLSLLSFFFKAPTDNEKEPVVNSFFKQLYAIKNFIKICNGIPIEDFTNLHSRF